jgi:hypothetical protein
MNIHSLPRSFRHRAAAGLSALSALAVLVLACTAYLDRPPPLPDLAGARLDLDGVLAAAEAYAEPRRAETAFGFDLRGAGLLPVRIALDHRGGSGVLRVAPAETFLIDGQGLAWPLLTGDQALDRVADRLPAGSAAGGPGAFGPGGRVTGFAAALLRVEAGGWPVADRAVLVATAAEEWGVPTAPPGEPALSLEERVRRDLAGRRLALQELRPGETGRGWLFFPDLDEIQGAVSLRLALEAGGRTRVVTIPLASRP